MQKVLGHLFEVSGLRVNANKSEVFCTGMQTYQIIAVQNTLNMKEGQFPERYIGIPLQSRSLRIAEYDGLVTNGYAHQGLGK